ncbi:PucR family transcriptional regulator (plasmid) [Streptomyces sp. CA-142005]|uniref:PucR family transcriptional regulator n=1 Tax=Streptomyces sp. CA-142005 TaxID=3240052 RepID=UPI003D945D61
MFPTLKDILASDAICYSAPAVLSGEDQLHRPVRWVHTSDLLDIGKLLRGNELVLATGIAFSDDRNGLRGYVQHLAEAGACGLVVQLGRRYTKKIPQPLIEAARQNSFPLVTLLPAGRFTDIAEALNAMICASRLKNLEAAVAAHRTFEEMALGGADPAKIVRQLAAMSQSCVVLENLAHQVITLGGTDLEQAFAFNDWEERSRGVRLASRLGRDQETGWLAAMVGTRGHDWARLVMLPRPCVEGDPAEDTDSHARMILLERGAAALALNKLVTTTDGALQRHTHSALLTRLLAHSITTQEMVLQASALGIPVEGRRLVGMVLRRSKDGDPQASDTEVRGLIEAAESAVLRLRLKAIIGRLDERTAGLLVALSPTGSGGAVVEELVTTVRQLHQPMGEGLARRREKPAQVPDQLIIGVGPLVDRAMDARHTLTEAAMAAEIAAYAGPVAQGHDRMAPTHHRLHDMRLRGLLHLLRDDPRLQAYVEHEIGLLLNYDTRHGTHLITALAAYLDQGRNKTAAAEAAQLSRPSLYERLARIERILGVDLTNRQTCLSLQVAIQALHAIRSDAPRSG